MKLCKVFSGVELLIWRECDLLDQVWRQLTSTCSMSSVSDSVVRNSSRAFLHSLSFS